MFQAIRDWLTGWRFWVTDRLRGHFSGSERGLIKTKTRSSKWPRVRREHLAREPRCQWCGAKSKLEIHHVKSFHLFPELELNPENLITLCECHVDCHLKHGHLGNWRINNELIKEQCQQRKKDLSGTTI